MDQVVNTHLGRHDLIAGLPFREVTDLSATNPPYLAATAYIATLAYPDSQANRDKFIKVATAYMAKYLRTIEGRQDVKALMKPRDIDRWWKRTMRKLNERMLADKIARTLSLARVGQRTGFVRVHGISNLRHAIGYVKGRLGHELPEGWHDDDTAVDHSFKNFTSRIWKPSKSVLHLAWGVWEALENGKKPRLEYFLYEPDWVLNALKASPTYILSLIDTNIVRADEVILLRVQVDPSAQK